LSSRLGITAQQQEVHAVRVASTFKSQQGPWYLLLRFDP